MLKKFLLTTFGILIVLWSIVFYRYGHQQFIITTHTTMTEICSFGLYDFLPEKGMIYIPATYDKITAQCCAETFFTNPPMKKCNSEVRYDTKTLRSSQHPSEAELNIWFRWIWWYEFVVCFIWWFILDYLTLQSFQDVDRGGCWLALGTIISCFISYLPEILFEYLHTPLMD